jgi:uncharacterized membrane protein
VALVESERVALVACPPVFGGAVQHHTLPQRKSRRVNDVPPHSVRKPRVPQRTSTAQSRIRPPRCRRTICRGRYQQRHSPATSPYSSASPFSNAGQPRAPDMRPRPTTFPEHILTFLAGVLIVKIVISIVSNYHNYVPPNFTSDFLRGREHFFFGAYQWAFYAHMISGPVSLILGLILISEKFRTRFPSWHRCLGRFQVACVLLLVTPSGLWMAYYAAAGPIAGVGLATLAIATAICVSQGASAAVARRFTDHRRWMWRCYLLLCSAVVLRLIGGLATVTGVTATWVDPLAAWISWLAPLSAFELREWSRRDSLEPDRRRAPVAQLQRDAAAH